MESFIGDNAISKGHPFSRLRGDPGFWGLEPPNAAHERVGLQSLYDLTMSLTVNNRMVVTRAMYLLQRQTTARHTRHNQPQAFHPRTAAISPPLSAKCFPFRCSENRWTRLCQLTGARAYRCSALYNLIKLKYLGKASHARLFCKPGFAARSLHAVWIPRYVYYSSPYGRLYLRNGQTYGTSCGLSVCLSVSLFVRRLSQM